MGNIIKMSEQYGTETPITDYADLEEGFPLNCNETDTY